jgi:hypothetical protein
MPRITRPSPEVREAGQRFRFVFALVKCLFHLRPPISGPCLLRNASAFSPCPALVRLLKSTHNSLSDSIQIYAGTALTRELLFARRIPQWPHWKDFPAAPTLRWR